MSTIDTFDADDIRFGFHLETFDASELEDPFDDAEVWLAQQDVPDHAQWEDDAA